MKQFALAFAMLLAPLAATPEARPSYEAFLEKVQSSPKTAAALFVYLDHEMPNYWDGTGWDYNGVSRTPGQGNIACGYFVTTLLQDLGLSIDRVRLSQAPSAVMIRELTVNRKTFGTLDDMLAYVEGGPAFGVYIVGLDFHTGFISHSTEGTFFIHSNFYHPQGVVRESALSSTALNYNDFFMIGSLTENEDLVKSWSLSHALPD